MRRSGAAVLLLVTISCSNGEPAPDAGSQQDAGVDARAPRDVGTEPEDDAGPPTPPAPPDPEIDAHRDRLLTTLDDDPCAAWGAMGPSARAVFLTITHRLAISELPDGSSMLDHVTRLYGALGGGADGTTCGGIANNRLFLALDDELWQRLVDTWNGTSSIGDGVSGQWIHTRDSAGPHDPFDASDETDVGLRCNAIFERPESRPPTAQLHFFLEGSAVAVDRGELHLPVDPRMLEIDQDFNCIHDSNPTCREFDEDYAANYGDFGCDWVPSECIAAGTGCYRGVTL